MALSDQDYCKISAAGELTFWNSVLKLLCNISQGIDQWISGDGPDTLEAVANSGTLAFGDVATAGYENLIVNTESAKALALTNGTDVTISVSTDGTNNLVYVPAGVSILLPLKELGLHINTTVSVKAVGSDATSGSVVGSLIYGS